MGDLVAGGWERERGGELEMEVDEEGREVRDGNGKGKGKGKGRVYEEYLSQDLLSAGLAKGLFHQGYFNASQYNYLEVS